MTTLTITNPFDQSPLAELPYTHPPQVDATLRAMVGAQREWARVPLEERIDRVRRGLVRFRQAADPIAIEITHQMGKAITEARAEVRTFCDRAEHMLSIAADVLRPDVLPDKPGFVRRIEHVPKGIVFVVGAWNYPLLIPVNAFIPALVAGNAVILKHSARTPLTGHRFTAAFAPDLPPGLFADVVLSHADTARLVSDMRVAHVAFTGSVEGGHEVYRAVAKDRFIDVGLELGGKDPAYIAADADLDFAVPNIVEGALYNAGQSCCAVERVYVHASVYKDVIERARGALKNWIPNDPTLDATMMGPLASRNALGFLEGQVNDAIAAGAKLLAGGAPQKNTRANFFPATLLTDVPNNASVMQLESFGPIIPLASVTSDDEALARMNDSTLGLTASVWTRDHERAERMARELEAGTIYQNRCDYLDPALPWTGFKDSGKGITLSKYGYYHVTKAKGLHFRL